MTLQPQDPDSVLKHALRLVAREVSLREAARELELIPHRAHEARERFQLASELRRERLRILFEAGVL